MEWFGIVVSLLVCSLLLFVYEMRIHLSKTCFFILGSIFSVKKFVPKLKKFFVSVIFCSIMLHGLLLSVIIFLNQVVLRAAIKAFMLTIFKPPLQYSCHKTVFLILLVPFQIKLKNSSFRSLSSFSFRLGSEMNK